jgi:transposase
MPRGRPDKLTAARQERVVAAVRAGAHREQAAQAAGVSRSTLQAWLQRGEAADAPTRFQKFAQALREAEAEFELEGLAVISRAAEGGDWRAMAWKLERRHPERWGRQTRHEVTGPDGGPVEVEGAGIDTSKLSMKELADLQTLMEKAAKRGA